MNATPQAKKYCRSLKNPLKRAYAQAYLLWLCQEGRDYLTKQPTPAPQGPSDLGYMAAQSVRMSFDRLMPGAADHAARVSIS